MIVYLLTAFSLVTFDAHWGWWAIFGVLTTTMVTTNILKES